VVLVGSEIEEEVVKDESPQWEYLELIIYCRSQFEDEEAGCGIWGYGEADYPDRTSILNEFGEDGWEIIYVNPVDSYGIEVEYLLKREK